MLEREPFLKAIFADPDNDLPRLVFADWLDDRGEHAWAEQVRIRCQLRQTGEADPDWQKLHAREFQLLADLPAGCEHWLRHLPALPIRVHAALLATPDELRYRACSSHPYWYGSDGVSLDGGLITDPVQVETLLRSPVTEYVTRLDLSGREEQIGSTHDETLDIPLIDFVYKPVITTRMVEHLCTLRECRRLVSLDLSRNELGNDAVRALVRSTNLIRLRELIIQDGNPRVKGGLWGELQKRFDEGVVR
jgi:uncharacterized protein (TIGR02996 family)